MVRQETICHPQSAWYASTLAVSAGFACNNGTPGTIKDWAEQESTPLRFKALMDLDLAVHASPGSHWGVRNATRNMNPKESYQCCCGREQNRQDSFKHLGNHRIV